MKTLLIILLIAFNAEFVLAKNERFGDACKPREPAITFLDAVDIAKREVSNTLNLEDFFIDLIQLNCVNGKSEWSVGFRRKDSESGHLIININMQKRTSRQVIKDG